MSKMSKSKGNEIGLFEDPKEIWAKLRTAKTDPARLRRKDPGNPDVCNIFNYHKFFSDDVTIQQVDRECRRAEIGCVDCKELVATSLERVVGPIRERAAELRQDPGGLDEILRAGPERASREAAETLGLVRDRIGLRGGSSA